MQKPAKTALVVTSIHAPNVAMRALASGCQDKGWDFILAGDSKSPPDFSIEGCDFLSLSSQISSGFLLAAICPEKSYTRKNIGYLTAIRGGAKIIVETDDDNHPRPEFWNPRELSRECQPVRTESWVNAYRYFTGKPIYPRGLPLIHARDEVPLPGEIKTLECPIQQGLADNDPDVDAIYRMLFPLPFEFEVKAEPVLLAGGAWCPFNSQNTTFFEQVFPLLYLPAWCSFRMTDIWRSFVAQRVLHHLDRGILFHSPTVWQERNEHDLHRDFMDELPGYSNNARIREELTALTFSPGESIQLMMEKCYASFIRNGWIGKEEESLLQAWFSDLQSIQKPS